MKVSTSLLKGKKEKREKNKIRKKEREKIPARSLRYQIRTDSMCSRFRTLLLLIEKKEKIKKKKEIWNLVRK